MTSIFFKKFGKNLNFAIKGGEYGIEFWRFNWIQMTKILSQPGSFIREKEGKLKKLKSLPFTTDT